MDLRTLSRAYDRSAATYDERFRELQRPKYRVAAKLLESVPDAAGMLARDAAILDAGAGSGLFAEWLADEAESSPAVRSLLRAQASRGRLLALDASVEMVRLARMRGVHAFVADLARPPLAAGSCSLVVSFTAILEQTRESMGALAALLEPGGLLCVSFLAGESPSSQQLSRWSGLTLAAAPSLAGQDLVHLLRADDQLHRQ